jgi:hypothetical protein
MFVLRIAKANKKRKAGIKELRIIEKAGKKTKLFGKAERGKRTANARNSLLSPADHILERYKTKPKVKAITAFEIKRKRLACEKMASKKPAITAGSTRIFGILPSFMSVKEVPRPRMEIKKTLTVKYTVRPPLT